MKGALMELRDLKSFVTLGEVLHFGQAAVRQHVTQSALSKQIRRLEEELGTRPAVVATGGDAALIARGVERIDHVDPDITLNGLRIAAVLNL